MPVENDNMKMNFQLRCTVVVWSVMAIVYFCYWSGFFLGNHDFRFIRYGVPLDSGIWEGRFTQFLPSWLLAGGHILPVFNVLTGFAFFALAGVQLAGWYGLPEKYRNVLPFALLIVLNPYVLTQLYYAHQILSIFVWHFLCVYGVVLIDRSLGEGRKKWQVAAGAGALFASLGGYAASLELILAICAGKFWLDILRMKTDTKSVLLHYVKLGGAVTAALLGYAAVICILKKREIIADGMYNVRIIQSGGGNLLIK